ncbi:adhesin [Novilysobacter antarcticus]|uniref:adhesin n=1 Tax=Novilysobacter antarcticus TaxID=2862543 RepID=UPI001C99469E|nr:adhesin [Lysobacter antarcticus]
MKIRIRKTAIALAVTTLLASPLAFAQSVDDPNVSADILHNHVVVEDWDITVDDTRNTIVYNDTTNNTSDSTSVNNYTNNSVSDYYTGDVSINDDRSYSSSVDNSTSNSVSDSYSSDWSSDVSVNDDRNYSTSSTNDTSNSMSDSYTSDTSITDDRAYTWSNDVTENIERTEVVNSDIRKEGNEHQVSVSLKKDLSLSSDISFTGNPTISGDIELDSAAIAIVDNRQSSSDNLGLNDMLTNEASIEDDVGSDASGNLAFNVAAGDNNVQDNAAALSAADASFAFGMADAEVFVNQAGSGNLTMNSGVTNDASMGGNAFSAASGNIGVNIAAGNNNQQKNALAASVATSAYAQSSVSSNQNSSGNVTDNAGHYERRSETVAINLTGTVDGFTIAEGYGNYEGTSQGTFEGDSTASLSGYADQIGDVYPDMWSNTANDDSSNPHPGGNLMGHLDLDTDTQGGSDLNGDGGALAFGVDLDGDGTVSGTTESSESGELGFLELGYAALDASLSGSVTNSYWIAVDATNTASLSGSAFSAASGNIGVNVAAGTGNLQANSLSLAVAQPSTGGGGGGGGGGEQ